MVARFGESQRPDPRDLAAAVLGALALSILVPTVARAYVDPSVVTYTIQAVAGVAVALGAVLGVALRRTRRAIFRIFKIDENANKVVDPEVHPVEGGDEAELAEADDRARQLRISLEQGRQAKRLNWPRRFARSLLGCGFLVATVLVFAPLEVVAASSGDLLFGFFDVAGLVFGVGVAIALLSALVVSLFRGRAFDVILTVVVAIGLCAYVQALFLNVSLPVADGQGLDLSDYLPVTILSAAVWAAVLTALLVLDAKRRPYCRAFVLAISAALLVVQAVSMVGIAQGEADEMAEAAPVVVGDYGLGTVGAEGNVTVFILDMFDTSLMDEVVADDPGVLGGYTGFTWYRNSVGSLIPTAWAVPYLVTGTMPEVGEDYEDYLDRRDADSAMLDAIEDQGYEITMYSDSLPVEAMEPYAANLRQQNHRLIDEGQLWPVLARVALYRDAPWVAKPLFWFWTDELNATAVDGSYVMDDVAYASRLRTDGLRISEDAERTVRFIHLLGAHWPYIMDKQGHLLAEEADGPLDQAEGALLIVSDYLDELRRLGLYDQSTVIVTSDHGESYITDQPLERPSTPILLVKPAETSEQACQPLEVSEVPTGHGDIPATIVAAVGGDSAAFGPTVHQVGEGPRDRVYWMTLHDGAQPYGWREYVISGDSQDIANWRLTDNFIYTTDRR